MERRTRHWAACGMLVLLAATGCRSMHSSVPPQPKYGPDGRQEPTVGFSTDAHPANQAGNPALGQPSNMGPGGMPPGMGGMQTGIPGPAISNYGVPGGAQFGAPGTSGAASTPGLGSPSTSGMPAGGAGMPGGMPGSN